MLAVHPARENDKPWDGFDQNRVLFVVFQDLEPKLAIDHPALSPPPPPEPPDTTPTEAAPDAAPESEKPAETPPPVSTAPQQ